MISLKKQRAYLPKIFGDSAPVFLLDALCQQHLQFLQNPEDLSGKWLNISELAEKAGVGKSTAKKWIDENLNSGFIEEKEFETHAQQPPRFIALNQNNNAVRELMFFFSKIRGFL